MSEKTVRTYYDLLELVKNLNSTPIEKGSKRELKLRKIGEKIKPIFKEYEEKRQDIRLDNAYTNDKGVLELNDKEDYTFTKEGLKKMNAELRELLNDSFDFYKFSFSTEGIEDLYFLDGWVTGITSLKEEDDEQV
jgi:hypothetical protein